MAHQQLPDPTNWKSRPVLIPFAVLFAAVISVYCVFETVDAIAASDWTSATVAGMFAAGITAFLASIAVGKLGSETLRAEASAAGTTFRSHPVAMALLFVAFLALAICSAVSVTGYLAGKTISIVPEGKEFKAFFAMSNVLLLSLYGTVAVASRGHKTFLRLSADRVEYADVRRTRAVPWDRIEDIVDIAPRVRAHHPAVLRSKGSDDRLVIHHLDGYVPHGATLYWMIRHYWLHPEDRHELEDGTALERLRLQDFSPE
ncbi:hypothetical protein [Arthrobacter sp. SLBN-53]|uniref:hypothetical protein n=1 Tax=Arthrobacter sp. SLBN-53 TaxID=2768412 RepID=UPI00115181EF|nr:hypothetical protein [Arthrobacter sp. SLBN-53]TQK30364.1 hypothetical protein FBY28_3383 [Arthrobacter sp. SLBN-53]